MRICDFARWLLVCVLLAPAVALRAADAEPEKTSIAKFAAEDLDFFEKKIRPVLVQHCYKCHSADAAKANQLKGGLRVDSRAALLEGGDSGAALAPGNGAESLLLETLRYDSLKMPPSGKLPATVIANFEAWIARGAADPRQNVAAGAARTGIDLERGRQHWCYQPLKTMAAPHGLNLPQEIRGPIDAFILAQLEARQLHSAPEAERTALVRRLYFDLVGLPPTPEDIASFVADDSADAYERLVERLLASPQFGERWGRHWLDVARFAESLTLRGFVLPEAWRYRDYVIEAFNADRPFDQFIREQIAGDLLPAAELDERRRNLIATTFLVLGNTNLEEQDKQQLRMDVVDEQLETICKGFLAQTVGCARCHDHKFDPIPTRDYYALAGILANSKTLEHANVSKWLEFPLPVEPDQEAVLKQHEGALAALQTRLTGLKDAAKLAAAGKPAGNVVAAKDLPGIVVDDRQAKVVGEWTLSQHTKPYIGEGYLHDIDTGKGEKTLTLLPELPQAGKYEVRLAYTPGSNRCESVPVTVFSADGEKTLRVNQRQTPAIDGRFVSLGEYRFELNGQGFVIVSNAGTQGHVVVDAVQFLPLDAPAAAKPVPESSTDDGLEQQAAAKRADEIRGLERELKSLTESGPKRPRFMSVQEEAKIADVRIHIRGTVHNLGETAPRGFLQVAMAGTPPALPADHSGRQELAEWIASGENPLTARVIANRVWHWLFGAGLVRTTDNFGTTGELPSHPELLDYLAGRLVAEQWSVKSLVREIVCSRTYRLASTNDPENTLSDPENRFLWRGNRRRLDAECLLDAMLAVSGELRLEGGGNMIRAGTAADFDYRHDSLRGAVYWPVLRNALPELFAAFDFADPSTVTGSRNTSTVAPQALFLMNNPWVTARARNAAKNLLSNVADKDAEKDAANRDLERVGRAFLLTTGKLPTAAENRLALDYLAADGAAADPATRQERWAQLIQALFGSLNFRYVE